MNTTRSNSTEPAHDILRPSHRPLDFFFAPRTVAVIGATEKTGSVGRTILWNLISSPFGGTVFPVNLKGKNVLGIKSYRSIGEVPEPVDLAVIVTPAATVPALIGECGEAGVKASIIISAGFKESGAEGKSLEQQVLDQGRRSSMRIIGPNCLGVMSPLTGLNSTFAAGIARPGNVSFISQSGALCTAILDWSLSANIGFSAFVSVGSMLDVGWGDLIYYFGDDPRTRSIVIYMETIGDARAFLSAAREVSLTKPIIVIKAGRTVEAAKAAASHTGSLAGSDEVLDAAFRRCGVLRVGNIADVFYMAEILAKQPRPKGPRLTIVTNAGGPAVLATDELIANGGQLADLSTETMTQLDSFLPMHWSHANPIDILGDAGPETFAKTVDVLARDANSDGILVILTPQSMTDPTQTAEQLTHYARLPGKPILTSWMGGAGVAAGEAILNRAEIPTFPYPDAAAHAFNYMWRYSDNLRRLYETPSLPAELDHDSSNRKLVEEIIQGARKAGRTLLTETESKQVLTAYGIPTVVTRTAASEDAAVISADSLGYPVVLKVYSETITHKTDVGGIKLNLRDAAAVRAAYREIESAVRDRVGKEHFQGVTVQPMITLEGYELIIGSSLDPQFGPVLLFGSGGQLVEVFKDHALALPPLNSTLARRMMEQTRIFAALRGVRGRKPIDLDRLEGLLVRFSALVVEQPWIREIDINPLLASPESLIALDARIVVHGSEVSEELLPRPAIRPYPTQYASAWGLKDGTPVMIRPIRPEDEPLMVKFHETLSEQSVYWRYFYPMKLPQRVAHDRLQRICFIDYDREMALVAEHRQPTGERQIVAVGRLSKSHDDSEAEFAILISDQFQRQGLGTEMLRRIVAVGRAEGLKRIVGSILPDNQGMQKVSRAVGFSLRTDMDEHLVKAELTLQVDRPGAA
jgi:acetyltransferase